MSDDLTILDPEPLVGSLLPYNYLPAAFSQLRSRDASPDAPSRIVFNLPSEDEKPRASIQYHVVPASILGVPEALARFLSERQFSDGDTFKRCILGPPTMLDKNDADKPLTLNFDRFELANTEVFDRVAVIIDIGIAFWNDRFRIGTDINPDSRFRAMRYLNFDAFKDGKSPFAGLSNADISTLCARANEPGGSNLVAAELGARFPDCYFDKNGGGVPDALWHGTATADLMAGLPLNTPDKTALFGIELPMAVLRDSDGDNLTAVLTLLIEAALEMTAGFADKPLVIMMAWGFTAGLQDGTHPAALAIQSILSAQADREVTLLVPAGNQLQDRCCAHLLPSKTPVPQEVLWHVPPDDFSINTIEFFVTPSASAAASGVQTVRIVPPAGATFVVAIKENYWAPILRDGQIIGVLLRLRDVASGPRLRLCLAATGWQNPGQLPAPAGDWTLSFAGSDDVSMWILRDDSDPMLDGPLPRRMSSFFDLAYQDRDALGDYMLGDDVGSAVVRSGTVSVLATATVKGGSPVQGRPVVATVIAVQANEQMIGLPERQAFYSGRRADGQAIAKTAVVDWGRQGSGVQAAANGTCQQVRITGTSAAVAMYARRYLGIPPDPS